MSQSVKQNAATVALRKELSVAKALGENAPVNIIVADVDLNVIYINPASMRTLRTIEQLLPCKVDEILGKNIDIFHKNPAHQRRMLADPKSLPHRAVIQLGKEKLDLLVSANYDADGSYLGPMVTWEVVTQKLELERSNAEAQSLAAAVSRSQAIIEFNIDGSIITANDNFCNALGYRVEEIRSQHHSLFVDAAYRLSPEYKLFWQRLAQGEYQTGEFKRVTKAGKDIWIQASYNPILDTQGKAYKVVKYASDITSQVEMRQNLQAVIKQVIESAAQFTEGARVIAESSQSLASGAQTQSSSVEEMSAAVEELARSIEAVRDNAGLADTTARETNKLAADGGAAVRKSIEAMGLIKNSSEQISEIIQVISGKALSAILTGVEGTATKISEIANSTIEQARTAQEVASSIQNVARVTEQVAAGSEEMASSSEELSAQAAALRETVVAFQNM